MLVGAKSVYPFFTPQKTQEFKVSDWWHWNAGYATQDLIRFDPPPRDGCYRMFRLRCTHNDDLPQRSKVCIELIFGKALGKNEYLSDRPTPFPPFTSSSILLQPTYGATLDNAGTMRTDVSVWFTIGHGTPADITPYLDAAPMLFSGLHGVPNPVKYSPERACTLQLHSVVLECWDFTDPHAKIAISLPNLHRSYAGTRLLTPGISAMTDWGLHRANETVLFSRQRQGATFGVNPEGVRYGYQLRGNFETSNPPERVLIHIKVPDSSEEYTWVFDDFQAGGSRLLQQKTSTSSLWFPTSWPALNGNFMVTMQNPSSECSISINWLSLDAFEYASEAANAIPVIPRALVFERPLVVKRHLPVTTQTLGTFQGLFTQGTPRLPVGTTRSFFIRISIRGAAGVDLGLDSAVKIKLIDLSGKHEAITFPFAVVQEEHGDQGEHYYRSPSFTLGDGQEPSLTHSDWRVDMECKAKDQTANGRITECVLEAVDEVVNNEHAPSGNTFSLALPGQPHRLPQSPNLIFHSEPFSLSVWFTSLIHSEGEEEEEHSTQHVVFSCGETVEMGFTADGALFVTLVLENGRSVTARWEDQDLDLTGIWYHIAFTWDGSKICLAVDGLVQQETFDAPGPLRKSNGEVLLGSQSFVGAVQSVAIWSEALSSRALRTLPYSIPPGIKPLMGQLEFVGRNVLTNTPSIPEWKDYSLHPSTKMLWETSALAIAPPAIASFTSDIQLHITAQDSYTLEAWIAPTQEPQSDVMRFIAGKQTARGHGYSIALVGDHKTGTRVVAFRGSDSVASMESLKVVEGGIWRHVAVSFISTSDPPRMNLFIDGVLSGTSTCTSLPPSEDIDDLATDFTVGGYGDKLNPLESFWGYIGTVRFWRVARSGEDIRDWMYASPDPSSPALAAEYGFTGSFASSSGDNAIPIIKYNAVLKTSHREVSIDELPSLSQRLLVSSLSLPQSQQVHSVLYSPDAVVSRRHTELLTEAEDDSTWIWVDFMVDMFVVLFDVLGFDTGSPVSLRNVCYAIWVSVEAIRGDVININTLHEEVMQAILDGGLEKVDLSQMQWNSAETLHGSDVTASSGAVKLFVTLLWRVFTSGHLRKLIQSLGRVTWSSMLKFEAKLVPYFGQLYLAIRIAFALHDLFKAITKLRKRLKENQRKHSKPGLSVTWAGGACSLTSQIPLRAGGSPQELKVELRPPSQWGPVTVSVTPSCAGLQVVGGPLVFPEGESGPRFVTVKAEQASAKVQSAFLSFQMQSKTTGGGINAGLDVRTQDLIMTPGKTSIDMDKKDGDKAELTLSFAAIIDVGATVEVFMEDITKDKDKEPHELKFKPEKLIFTRQTSTSHRGKEQKVEVTIKKKEKKVADVDDVTPNTHVNKTAGGSYWLTPGTRKQHKTDVHLTGTHTTRITMVPASKGDCYILSDRFGDNGTWNHALIDGGVGGTFPRMSAAFDALDITTLDLVCATHYDADHIGGLLKLLEPGSIRPDILQVWFNDPNRINPITDIVGDDLFPNTQAKDTSNIDPAPLTRSILAYPDRLETVDQGRDFVTAVKGYDIPVASPRGCGPAISNDTYTDHAPAVFPYLLTQITGPTNRNVTTMRNDDSNSVSINRSSSIFTIREKPDPSHGPGGVDAFSALFTGDAWDVVPDHNHIRRGIGLLGPTARQHFTVMKVPHHGSKHSEDAAFYHAYTAKYYLISSRYSAHKIPAIESITAILEGCYQQQREAPIIVTTSLWDASKISEKLVPLLVTLLNEANYRDSKVYIFNDPLEFATLEFKNGTLEGGWKHGMWVVTYSGSVLIP